MIRATLKGDRDWLARLDAMPGRVRAEVGTAVAGLGAALQAEVRNNRLSGQVLAVRSGRLRDSVAVETSDTPDRLAARVSATVPYAAIQEFGGVTAPHEIRLRRAQALAFTLGGRLVFAKRVRHPGSRMPERSFLRSALADMAPEIRAGIGAAVARAVSP